MNGCESIQKKEEQKIQEKYTFCHLAVIRLYYHDSSPEVKMDNVIWIDSMKYLITLYSIYREIPFHEMSMSPLTATVGGIFGERMKWRNDNKNENKQK